MDTPLYSTALFLTRIEDTASEYSGNTCVMPWKNCVENSRVMFSMCPFSSTSSLSKFHLWWQSGGTSTTSPSVKGSMSSPTVLSPCPLMTHDNSQKGCQCMVIWSDGKSRT